VHPALREDAARGAMAAAARAVETKDRKDKEVERKDRRDKGGGREDRTDKERERKDRKDDRKHREKTKTECHSEAVEAEPFEPQKGTHKEKSERLLIRRGKENEDTLKLKSEHLEDPKSRVKPSNKPHRSTSQQHQRRHGDPQELPGSEALAVLTSQPAAVAPASRQHKHHKRKDKDTTSTIKQPQQIQTQEAITPASVDVSRPSAPTSSPASMPKPFPIHILLRRITTSYKLSPRQKSSLLTTLHGSLVDISIRTSLELDLAQHYGKIAAQAAAVQDLIAEIEDPTPDTPVSLANLKASGALGGYLFGTPGLGPVRKRSGSESSSLYSQDGMDEAWEDFLDEEGKSKGKSAGIGRHDALSDAVLDAESSQLEVAVRSLKITKSLISNELDAYCRYPDADSSDREGRNV